MSSTNKNIFLDHIHPSWIKYLHDLHWSGSLDVFLSKGYASFTLTDEERKKWNISNIQENRIRELLQSAIDESNVTMKKNDLLSLLASVDIVFTSNLINDKQIIDEIHEESIETNHMLQETMLPFVEPVISQNSQILTELFLSWQGRHIRNVFHKGIAILVDLLIQKEIFYSYTTIAEIEQKLKVLKPFYLMLYFYFNKYPDKERIEIFRYYLLKKDKSLTDCIDGIVYRSWKYYPDEMYVLTQEWIDSKNPILINWLIHGIEVPGRNDPLKALHFLDPVFYIDDSEVTFIISHVTATILCSDPNQVFHIFEELLRPENSYMVKDRLLQSLLDIVTDKFINKNKEKFDFPDLNKIIFNKMNEWNKIENSVFQEISEPVLEKIYLNPLKKKSNLKFKLQS